MTSVRILLSAAVATCVVGATSAGDRGPADTRGPAVIASPHPGTASLPRFALFGWVAPPAESTTLARYAEYANAGLNTTVLAWEDPGQLGWNLQRLACSQPVGVKNLLLDLRLDRVHENAPATFAVLDSVVHAYKDQPAFLGYYLGDEPEASEFPRKAEFFRLLRARDPLHPGWNNLRGRSGGTFTSHQEWIDYLRSYVAQVQPAVLSTDEYDHRTDGDVGRFIENVAGTAQVARESNLPFWGILLVTPHLMFRDPDDALLRWQVAQWLSYGARGIGYFTYWTPAPDSNVHWGDGMIRYGTGERTRHYDRVRTLNLRVRPLGEYLAGLTWLATEHSGGTPVGGTPFAPDSLVAAISGRAALGTFADANGTPHLFVANRDSAAGQDIAIVLAGERTVERYAEVADRWDVVPRTAVASGTRIELALDPGDFALLRVSGACGPLSSGDCRASLGVTPNPAATGFVRFTATRVTGPASLSIVDVTGRRIWSRTLVGSSPAVDWNGRTDAGLRVRPGFYWARLSDARGDVVRRVTWLGVR